MGRLQFQLFLFLVLILSAQSSYALNETKRDSSFIKSYRDLLILKASLVSKNNQVILENNQTKEQLRYKPNEWFRLGLGFNYKWMGLSLNLFNPLKKVNTHERGITKGLDIQSNIYLRKIGMDLFVHSYRSYYLSNRTAYSNSPVILEDMATFAFGGDFFYIFNGEEFSFRASFNQTEKQLKSAGTWLAGFKTGVYIINTDSGLVPAPVDIKFNDDFEAKSVGTVSFGVGGGYAYTKVVEKMFYTLSCFPNLTIEGLNYDMVDYPTKVIGDSFFHVQWKGAIGYNSNDHYLALFFVNESIPLGSYFNTSYKYRFGNLKITAAKRF